jgi:hypothetical protein
MCCQVTLLKQASPAQLRDVLDLPSATARRVHLALRQPSVRSTDDLKAKLTSADFDDLKDALAELEKDEDAYNAIMKNDDGFDLKW